MKNAKLIFFYILFFFVTLNVKSQNADPSLAVQTSNAGVVEVGAVGDVIVTITNTLSGNIPQGRMRPIVTIPASVVFLADALQTGLPAGYTIVSNTGQQLRVCNSSTNLAGLGQVTIVLKIRGVTVAPATTIFGQFNPGTNCANGPSIAGDVPGNNAPTTTIQVVTATVPLTLTSFTGFLKSCTPALTWITENEVNTKSFDIEKSNTNGNDWKKVGTVAANGNSSTKLSYNFNDFEAKPNSDKLFYKLKMIDLDGRYTYSAILPLNGECKEATLNVYPNPIVDHKLFVNLTGMNAVGNASLITLTGQVVFSAKVNNGNNSLVINNVVDGIYILNVKDAFGFDKNIKVFVIN